MLNRKSKNILSAGFFFILTIFFLINFIFSQTVSPLFLGMVNYQRQAVVEYLKRIKLLPQFSDELKYYQRLFGMKTGDEVFKDERERKKEIAKLEQLLTKNDQARDVLYKLYLLYKADGNQTKAEEYLKMAKEIDPIIK